MYNLALIERFKETRAHTLKLCENIHNEDMCLQLASFVSPTKWHLAHTTWFFEELILKQFEKDYQRFNKNFPFYFNSCYKSAGEHCPQSQRGIIFCRTKAGAQNLASQLIEEGFSTAALEGDMQQKERDKVMRAFKNESLQYLISTDVSARGIDVRGLEFVIHHQLPEQLEYYTHRSGRTARAGKTGISMAFILPSELEKIHQIQKELNIKFTEVSV